MDRYSSMIKAGVERLLPLYKEEVRKNLLNEPIDSHMRKRIVVQMAILWAKAMTIYEDIDIDVYDALSNLKENVDSMAIDDETRELIFKVYIR